MTKHLSSLGQGIEIHGAMLPGFERVLTPDALAFVALLARRFRDRRDELLQARVVRQQRLDAGEMPGFLPETQHVRDGDCQPQDGHQRAQLGREGVHGGL